MDHPTRRLDPHDLEPLYNAMTRQLGDSLLERSQTCPKCAGPMVWARGAAAPTHGAAAAAERPLYLEQLYQERDWAAVYSVCLALVCTTCGFTELYTHEPADVVRDYYSVLGRRSESLDPTTHYLTPDALSALDGQASDDLTEQDRWDAGTSCPKCSGAMVWARTYLYGPRPQPFYLSRLQTPSGTTGSRYPSQAATCPVCGYTELYMVQPTGLRAE
ncbi:MAG: hypothetical protein M3Z04_14920 [Chloroflexota bacterium]|nr:hypothetical protein [Chloroflexota bacterium]